MASPAENDRLNAAEAQVARFKARAQAFLQPGLEGGHRSSPMTFAMILIINAIILVRRLEATWTRPGRIHRIRFLTHTVRLQSGLYRLLHRIPLRNYVLQLLRLDQLSDKQMEELRLFHFLIDELEDAAGVESEKFRGSLLRGAQVWLEYSEMALNQAEKLTDDIRDFLRMAEEYIAQNGMNAGQPVT